MAIRNWIGLFLLGAINNLPYVVVNSAASTIADSFNEKNLVGVVFGANVALAVLVKGLNTFALLKVSYAIRYIVNGGVMLIGLFGIAYASSFGFAIACIAVLGSTSAFGENVTLGFLSRFPSSLVTAWSSGTGMAGLLGSSLFITFGCVVHQGSDQTKELQHLDKYAFLLTTPVVFIYWLAYFVVIKRPPVTDVVAQSQNPGSEESNPSNRYNESHEEDIIVARSAEDINHIQENDPLLHREETVQRSEKTCARIMRCSRLILWMGINLCAVYVFEYVARGCAAKVRPTDEYHKGCPELYASLQLCYQAGVFVSRSSVQLVRIRRVEILSILQFVNMVVWIVDVHYKFLPVSVLPALMVYVGLLGGASYVNIFYSLLHDDVYPDEDRELCVNITCLFITLGIIMGTGLETAVFTTLLKSD